MWILNFNPRTREGCDQETVPALGHDYDFNPRTREGCDTTAIHTGSRALHFNPRTREGCDHGVEPHCPAIPAFQSTHPRGVRLAPVAPVLPFIFLFQSTHPRGVRRGKNSTLTRRGSFQSTHPRGVRLRQRIYSTVRKSISIHAPARGATRCQ